MRFFWPISCQIANYTIRKKEAARTRIWPCNGHYMGLNLGVIWKTGLYKWFYFGESQSDGFTGVFQAPILRGNRDLPVS
jgi:hypothetical protein